MRQFLTSFAAAGLMIGSAAADNLHDAQGHPCQYLPQLIQIDGQFVAAQVFVCQNEQGNWIQSTPIESTQTLVVPERPVVIRKMLPPPPVTAKPTISTPLATKLTPVPEPAEDFVRRGDEAITIGDIAAARLLYNYAATKGNAIGAFKMGKTFDEDFLRSINAFGLRADPKEAAHWYERATEIREKTLSNKEAGS